MNSTRKPGAASASAAVKDCLNGLPVHGGIQIVVVFRSHDEFSYFRGVQVNFTEKEAIAKGLEVTAFIDHQHPEITGYVAEFSSLAELEKAKAIYLKVRDGFLYDPYHLDLRTPALTASAIPVKRRAWCVEKAIVCCAGFRALGIPARLGFGIVKNHIGVEKLVHYLRTDEIVFHGFVEAYVDGKWTKCTPAFDRRICALSGVTPLEWNCTEDSLFQAYRGEERYMEYLHFYGVYYDVPQDLMRSEMQKYYPHLFSNPIDTPVFSFRF